MYITTDVTVTSEASRSRLVLYRIQNRVLDPYIEGADTGISVF